MLKAGRITGAYGIKGWVRVHPFTESAEDFLSFGSWFLERRGVREPVDHEPVDHEPIDIVQGRRQGRGLVVRVAGIDDRDEAEKLRGMDVWVPDGKLPVLEAGDYYWHQLTGLAVVSEYAGETLLLGKVDYLLETGANDVLVVKPGKDSIDERERLIPYLPDTVVKEIDLQAGRITVAWHPDD